MTANELMRPVVLALIVLLTSFGQSSAQHMNAKDAPCQGGTGAEDTRCFLEEAHRADLELLALWRPRWRG